MGTHEQAIVFSLSFWGPIVLLRFLLSHQADEDLSNGKKLYFSSALYSSLLILFLRIISDVVVYCLRIYPQFCPTPLKTVIDGAMLIVSGLLTSLLYRAICNLKKEYFYTYAELKDSKSLVTSCLSTSCLSFAVVCIFSGRYETAATILVAAVGIIGCMEPGFIGRCKDFVVEIRDTKFLTRIALFSVFFNSILTFVRPDNSAAGSSGLITSTFIIVLFCLIYIRILKKRTNAT